MTATTLAPDDSGEHDALDDPDELAARFGPRNVVYLDRDPADRAAGWLVAILVSLVLWLLVGLGVLLTVT